MAATQPKNVVAIIPARMASQRLPGKMLLSDTGMPLVAHVAQRAASTQAISRVVVATDHQDIKAQLASYEFEVIMTSVNHPNGTSRLAEAASTLGLNAEDIVVNVQGDEPEIEADVIEQSVTALTRDADVVVGTVGVAIPQSSAAITDPNIVKVVRAISGRALYFSRSAVPYDREGTCTVSVLKHVGIYAYRVAFLHKYVTLEPTPLEQSERLEQLRVLEHGYEIGVGIAASAHAGIDTQDQYDAFVQRWNQQHSS